MDLEEFEKIMQRKYDEVEVPEIDVEKIIQLAKQRKKEEEERKLTNRIKNFFKSKCKQVGKK